MSDSYQPIFDAARMALRCDPGSIIESVAREAFDISWQKSRADEAILAVAMEWQRPSVLMRPALSIDGNQWCALYGANLQDGVAGFGDSPALACAAFDAEWTRKIGDKS